MKQYNFTVDADTREISIDGKPIIVKGDVNVTEFVFIAPKVIHGIDMSGYSWRVWYTISDGSMVKRHFHTLTATPSGDNVSLSWVHNGDVAKTTGVLSFALSVLKTDEDDVVTEKWNSLAYTMKVCPTVGGGVYTLTDPEQEYIADLVAEMQQARDTVVPLAEQAAEDAETASQAKDTAVSASTSAVTANTQAQAAKEAIDTAMESFYSLGIVEEASGDPASFADGASNVPMKSVSVGIEPVQDLHGYEYPWVGGAGKNLLPTINSATGVTPMNATYVSDDDTGMLKVTSTSATTTQFVQVYYTVHPNISIGDTVTFSVSDVAATRPDWMIFIGNSIASVYSSLNNSVRSTTFTVADTTDIVLTFRVSQYRNIAIGDILEVKGIQLEKGSTATTFAPYSNICPISGWDEVKVTRTGKNLFDPSKATDGKYINSDGEEGTSATFTCSDYIPVHGIRMVYFSGFNGGWGNAPCYALYDKDKRKIRATHPNTNITSFPVTIEGAYYLRTSMAKADKGTVMIEVGDTATSYEPYAGQTYPISLTSAGTVYGGTLDVITGQLLIDRANIVSYNGETLPSTWISDRDKYADGAIPTIGAQVVYNLATPLTYTITPSQITSLLGTNHVWADCGEISCEYVADTKMYIQNLLNQ